MFLLLSTLKDRTGRISRHVTAAEGHEPHSLHGNLAAQKVTKVTIARQADVNIHFLQMSGFARGHLSY